MAFKIALDAKEAKLATEQFRRNLKAVGLESKLTANQLEHLETKMKGSLETKKGAANFDQLARSANLSKTALAGLQLRVGNISGAFKTLAGNITRVILRWGKLAALAGVAAVIYGLKKSVNAFQDFETALVDMAKVTDESLDSIKEKMLNLPAVLGHPTELMKGYYQVISAGVRDAAEAQELLVVASQSAKAAHMDQSEMIKAITKSMVGFGDELENAADAADLLFMMEKQGQTTVQELVPVIGDLANITKLADFNVNEMAAALTYLTQTSGSTSEASTKLRAIIVSLMKPTANTRRVIHELGKELGFTSAEGMRKTLGLAGSIQALAGWAKKADTDVGRLFESQEALAGVGALLNDEFAEYIVNLREIENRAGAAQRAFDDWEKTLAGVKDTFRNTISKIAIEIGRQIAPDILSSIKTIGNFLEQHKDEIVSYIKTVMHFFDMLTKAFDKLLMIRAKVSGVTEGIPGIGASSTISKTINKIHDLITAGNEVDQAVSETQEAAAKKLYGPRGVYATGTTKTYSKAAETAMEQLLKAKLGAAEAKIVKLRGDVIDEKEKKTKTQTEQERRVETIKTMVTALKMEAETLGYTKRQLSLYQAEKVGLLSTYKDEINKAYDTIEAYERINTAHEKAKRVLETLEPSYIKMTKALKEYNELLEAGRIGKGDYNLLVGFAKAENAAELARKEEDAIRRTIDTLEAKQEIGTIDRRSANKELIKQYEQLLEKQKQAFEVIDKYAPTSDAWEAYQQAISFTTQELIRVRQEHERLNGTMHEGFQKGLKTWIEDSKTYYEMGEELAQSTAMAMQDSFSSFFFDMWKGELKTAEDYFRAFADSVMKTFFDMIAQMAAKKLITSIFGDVTNSSGGGGLAGLGKTILGFFGANTGGYFPKSLGDPTKDSVMAAITPGEYVIKSSSVDKYGTDFLDMVNSGVLNKSTFAAQHKTNSVTNAITVGPFNFSDALSKNKKMAITSELESEMERVAIKVIRKYS